MSARESTESRTELRLLAVHAHPDDEASKGAAMMAAYAAAGVDVMVATCTGGEQGSILNPGAADDPAGKRDLAGLRRREMEAARAALGIRHRWLGFADSGLPEGDPLPELPFGCFALQPLERAAAPLVKLVREFRPHVIVSYDENGGYPHPDHIMAHKVAVEAFSAAGDPERYKGTGEAWEPLKLYYDRAFNPERFRALHVALEAAGLQSPYAERLAAWQEADTEGHQPPAPLHPTTTQVECGDFFEARDEALRSHRTQVDPEGFFFAVSPQMQREVWPWEDYSLIESRVETVLPETDLFAGIR
ncbi:mycothiol conjugate amidase Mca [Arthrobacter zhangbolii]|uniref:Mycothiol S-conjugate amidase n=1 Tax=Arthrobacter zhangbolii TaxID=2886936 RepID=A0A9X1S9W6_9MICC|nr:MULTISPECIES: mycothiol conjugate amidase Mca [Arthrobacter]MCC3272906.1 mycothiol conjugate amidase Mca [Arthrobacter zhangbolii]MCC3295240.1 mycothiol conjugate amidase Mca [Arthrobacter zhangbolii]MDN3905322.1 mycothiol conjugate amidase Mca [Arthrobacter sp. YD2]UON92963.1 mycothiol conjugate amidase Mca [Arthrobacter zhangbolii]